MKGLFIIMEPLHEHRGISKKIISQVDGFINNGITMELSYLAIDTTNRKRNFSGRMIGQTMIEKFSENNFISKIQRITSYRYLLNYIKLHKANFVYLRYTHFANPFFIRFLKNIKKSNIKIYLEIPTFPYDLEYKNVNIKKKIFLEIEKKNRTQFKKYVDKIVTFANEKKIFGVKTIKINNGIDLNAIPIKTAKVHNFNEIHLIAVASMELWHGYDRIIEGLKIYYSEYQKIKIILHLVGSTEKKHSIKNKSLIEKYDLSRYVVLHGIKSGLELDSLFDLSDIAIGCLGVHRKGIVSLNSLKNSEYCARGIPFIYSENDDSFDNKDFILRMPADDTPVDINKIIDFLHSKSFSSKEIRKYAEENLTWNFQIKRLIDELNIN